MEPLKALAMALAVFGLLAVLLAGSHSLRLRRTSAIGHSVLAVLLLAASALLWSVGSALATYQIARHGQPVADLYFERLGDARFRVTLTRLPGGRMQVFDLGGAAWRLDARRLTWRGWALNFGLELRYQLDRLTGLASAAEPQRPDDVRPEATYGLGDAAGIEFWQRARTSGQWRRIVDARHVYGPNVPMVDGARFVVTMGNYRLEPNPANETAAAMTASER
jgi:hypothetical protein